MELSTDEIKQQLDLAANGQKRGFPIDVFPTGIQGIIKGLKDKQGFPVDFTGAGLLFAASVAAGNGFHIERPFSQTPVLYLALVGDPGKIKTHPLSWAVKPLEAIDAESYKQYLQEKEQFEKDETGEISKPHWKQFLVKDVTPEALCQVHANNLKGIGLYRDELSGWFGTFDRYHNNSDTQFWLSNWSLQSISINRKTTEPFFIESPSISVSGTIQTALLEKLAGNNRSEIGFLDRILFAFPENLKASSWNENTDSRREFSLWAEIVNQIAKASKDRFESETTLVQFSDEAFQSLLNWQNENAKEIDRANDEGDYSKAQMLSKLEVYALRLALLLSILKNPESPFIDEASVKGAIKLINYFRECGEKVREKAGVSTQPDKKAVIQYLAGLGASQNDIAKAVKISQPYVNKILKG